MSLENLTPALGSTHSKKRDGRGQGSGTGKTAAKGHKGQRARAGFSIKRGFEGGQQPLQRRLPKVGFNSRVVKPYAINVDKNREILELEEITIDSIKSIHKMTTKIKRVKLIGSEAKALVAKIKDDNVTVSGN